MTPDSPELEVWHTYDDIVARTQAEYARAYVTNMRGRICDLPGSTLDMIVSILRRAE